MKELKKVASMLGTMLSKEELDEFMAEADAVSRICNSMYFVFMVFIPRMEMESWTMMSLSRCYSSIDVIFFSFN